jgi:hypothetical protein
VPVEAACGGRCSPYKLGKMEFEIRDVPLADIPAAEPISKAVSG